MSTIEYSCGHQVSAHSGQAMPMQCACGEGEIVGAKGRFYMTAKPLQVDEWDGAGRPPVGTECGMSLRGLTRPKVCITYIGQGVFCYRDMNTGNEYTGATCDAIFIARKTQAQREREEVISTAHALLIDTDTDRTVDGTLAALYDTGMLRRGGE